MACLYPGSFDPPTVGHEDIAKRAAKMFGSVIVCVMENDEKHGGLFSAEERADMLRKVFEGAEGVTVMIGSGLTADVAKKLGVQCVVKGVRDSADFPAEARLAAANMRYNGTDTALICGAPEYSYISSSMVREIMRRGGSLSGFVPDAIVQRLQAYRFI